MNNYQEYLIDVRRKKVAKLLNLIKDKGGEWINKKEYRNSQSKCFIRCKNGHEFERSQQKIVSGTWCSVCNQKLGIGEEISRIVLEEILQVKLLKTRNIENLISPFSGYPLEIDGFNSDISLGFEYQGLQHVGFVPHIHKTEDNFNKTQVHDKVKKDYFEEKGWVLLQIPQFSSFDLEEIVKNLSFIILEKLKTKNDCDFGKVKARVDSIFLFGKYFKVVSDFANNNGLIILDGKYSTKEDAVLFRCHTSSVEKKIKIKNILDGNLNILSMFDEKTLSEENLKKNSRVIASERKYKSWNLESATKAVDKCKNLVDFQLKYPGAMGWIIRNGYYKELTRHYPKKEHIKKWKYSELLDLAKNYVRRSEFRKKHRGAYNSAQKMNILEDICSHMPFDSNGNPKVKKQ